MEYIFKAKYERKGLEEGEVCYTTGELKEKNEKAKKEARKLIKEKYNAYNIEFMIIRKAPSSEIEAFRKGDLNPDFLVNKN